ncbi:MAG TPA: PilX N-terminal domain-containing pilus assembly protein [Aquabacterium sp.]|nr:PilX N-terminal domain-containing pilus assembly protein [Aquabacterium sp.]
MSQHLHSRTQHGIALIVVLVFLLALTAISLYGARQAVFGERVARNVLDAQVAHQAAEAALRDAEADLAMPEGKVPAGAYCLRTGMRPVAAHIASLVDGASCLGGICRMTDAQYAAVDLGKATAASSPTDTPTGEPWWADEKGGRWNNHFATKPQSVNDQCGTFTGGVPLGTYTGAARIAEVAQQPEYLIEYMGMRNERPLFRITARGFGYAQATQAVVQGYFVPPESE